MSLAETLPRVRAVRLPKGDALVAWILPLTILIGWQAAAVADLIPAHVLPAPSDVAIAAWKLAQTGELPQNIWVSFWRAVTGFAIGGTIGFSLGLANGLSKLSERVTDTTLQMVRNVPHLAMIPLVILWFGIDEAAKLFLVALGVFFPIYLNTLHGIRTVDPQLIEMGRSYGMSRGELFRRVIFPGALPSIFVGLRFALGIIEAGTTFMKRMLAAAALLLVAAVHANAQPTLRIGDQKGNARAVMEAAGALNDVPYRIDWKEFPAAAPLLEALSAGAIEAGLVGDAPFTFAAGAKVPVKAIAAIRQTREGLAILVPKQSAITSFADLKGKKIGTGRGSVGHQLLLAALEKHGMTANDVQVVFLLPSDAKIAYSSGSIDAWSTWEPYVSQEEVLFGARRIVTGEGLTPGLSFLVSCPEPIAEKRSQLEDFVRRLTLARAWARSQANLANYADTWGKLMGIPKEVPLQWFRRARIGIVPIDESVVSDEQSTIDLYFRAGLIKDRLDAKVIVDASFNAAIEQALRDAGAAGQ
jgi:sulfonate transport system substrate-binding protein